MRTILIVLMLFGTATAYAQAPLPKVYDEERDPMEQIDEALLKAQKENKFVMAQVGGIWCPWCLRFADFAKRDTTISRVIDENYVYIHVNYDPRKRGNEEQLQSTATMMQRLGNPARFGFPVFVILRPNGKVLHTQDSSFLEEGQGYNQKRVLRFLQCWTPTAVYN